MDQSDPSPALQLQIYLTFTVEVIDKIKQVLSLFVTANIFGNKAAD